MAYAINPWLPSPIQLNYAPATSVFPGGPTVVVVNGFLVVEAGYRTNYEGDVDQPYSVDQFVFDFFGNLVSSQPNTTVNSTNPHSNPLYAFSGAEDFGGTTYANEFMHLGDTQNSNGTYNINYYIDSVSDSGNVTNVTAVAAAFSNLTLPTPTATEVTGHDFVYGKLEALGDGNMLVAAASLNPSDVQQLLFQIISGNGSVVVPTVTFSDPNWTAGDVYTWDVLTLISNPSSYALVTVDTSGSGSLEVSSLHLWSISTSGTVSSVWTAATNFETIDRVDWERNSSNTGIFVDVTGTTATGYDHQILYLNDSNGQPFNGVGLTGATEAYVGIVTEAARILGLGDVPGSSPGLLEYWVDGNGLTLQEVADVNNALVVEATYNIADANGSAGVVSLGDGRFEVTWQVVHGSDTAAGSTAQEYMDILDLRPSAIDGTGTPINGYVAGTPFNDLIIHSPGNMTIDGGGGQDIYEYQSFTLSQLTITYNPNGTVNVVAPDGTDTLSGIQYIEDSTGAESYVGAPIYSAAQINNIYQAVLQRAATTGEQTAWTTVEMDGQVTEAEVLNDIVTSQEALTYVYPVVRLYQAAFDRVPDQAGLMGWVGELESSAVTVGQIAQGFVNSAEFLAHYGTNQVTNGFVEALYENVLGRAGSTSEVSAWVNSGQTAAQILTGFSNSLEFQNDSRAAIIGFLDAAANGTESYQGPL